MAVLHTNVLLFVCATVTIAIAYRTANKGFGGSSGSTGRSGSVNAAGVPSGVNNQRQSACVPLLTTNKICGDVLKYSDTKMPNILGHFDQTQALQSLQQLTPLIQVGCSDLASFFFCSVHFPMCHVHQSSQSLVVPPCQSMCESVMDSCGKIVKSFISDPEQLPSSLRCENLPRDGIDLCMSAPNGSVGGTDAPRNMNPDVEKALETLFKILNPADTEKTQEPAQCSSPQFAYLPGRAENKTCFQRCNVDYLFASQDKRFMEVWATAWAAVSFVTSLFTVCTCLIDTSRFQYPERPIIFMAFCSAIYALAFLIKAVAGREKIACEAITAANGIGGASKTDLIMNWGGLENPWCIVAFLVLYYFNMSASVWWLILTLTWFLASARKWSQEAINRLSSYFHLLAWAIPAIQAIIVLTTRNVLADELTGLCFVSTDYYPTMLFLVGPLTAYLAFGTIFTLGGFVALFRIRKNLREGGTNIRKLEKLMCKIGVFTVLYIIPSSAVLACNYYELSQRESWLEQAKTENCIRRNTDGPSCENGQCSIQSSTTEPQTYECTLAKSIPTTELFLIKYFMLLVVGIVVGVWVLSSKTLHSWKGFCAYRFGPQKSRQLPTRWHRTTGRGGTGDSTKRFCELAQPLNSQPVVADYCASSSGPYRAINTTPFTTVPISSHAGSFSAGPRVPRSSEVVSLQSPCGGRSIKRQQARATNL